MEIKHEEKESKGAFYVEVSEQRLAEMTYSKAGDDLIIIDHTEVSDELRGKSVGKQMVEEAVQYARSNNLKVLPLCPFAKAVFDKVENYRDVLKGA